MGDTVFSKKLFFFNDFSFSSFSYPFIIVEDKLFEGCRFINVNLSESQFIRCKFVDCAFDNSNLSAAQFSSSSFNNIIFFESKATGINWTMLNWPHIWLSSPFQ